MKRPVKPKITEMSLEEYNAAMSEYIKQLEEYCTYIDHDNQNLLNVAICNYPECMLQKLEEDPEALYERLNKTPEGRLIKKGAEDYRAWPIQPEKKRVYMYERGVEVEKPIAPPSRIIKEDFILSDLKDIWKRFMNWMLGPSKDKKESP